MVGEKREVAEVEGSAEALEEGGQVYGIFGRGRGEEDVEVREVEVAQL